MLRLKVWVRVMQIHVTHLWLYLPSVLCFDIITPTTAPIIIANAPASAAPDIAYIAADVSANKRVNHFKYELYN